MKKLITIMLITMLYGCSDPIPVNPDAVKHCLDKGMIPCYYSDFSSTKFTCEPTKRER